MIGGYMLANEILEKYQKLEKRSEELWRLL